MTSIEIHSAANSAGQPCLILIDPCPPQGHVAISPLAGSNCNLQRHPNISPEISQKKRLLCYVNFHAATTGPIPSQSYVLEKCLPSHSPSEAKLEEVSSGSSRNLAAQSKIVSLCTTSET